LIVGGSVFNVKSLAHVVFGSLLIVGLSSCGDQAAEVVPAASSEGQAEAEVQLLDAASAATFVAENNPTIIDVRTPEEFAAGYIAGATLIDISSPGFVDAISALDRSATYFVYCRSGNRSATATSQMIDLGFTSVYELDGGIVSWAAAGNDIQI